ncbi:MAG: DUF4331 family protein [Myxococcales bacterium]|nr:DUF4331 family protein [Myxococcales bacterium]
MSAKTWALALALAASGAFTPLAVASDHADGSNTVTPPLNNTARDIADLYSWMGVDEVNNSPRVFMVMTVQPNAPKATSAFDKDTLYTFHTIAKGTLSEKSDGIPELSIVCAFNDATPIGTQTFECWGGDDEYVKGTTSTTTTKGSILSRTGKLRVWTGIANDPAFFNKTAFNSTVTTIKAGINGWNRDTAQCATSGVGFNATTLRAGLATGNSDAFTKQNVLAIVVSVDRAYLTSNNSKSLVGVWASTKKRIPK